MRRTMALLALACLGGSALGGCGSPQNPTTPENEAPRAPGDSVPESGPSGATPGGKDSGDVGSDSGDGSGTGGE